MTLLGITALLLIVAAWILRPLLRPTGEVPSGPGELEELEAQHRELLHSLQDLDFELQTGKLSPEDHRTMRRRLQGEAVAVLQKLEQVRGGTPSGTEPPAGREA